jgi:hypothetical protein
MSMASVAMNRVSTAAGSPKTYIGFQVEQKMTTADSISSFDFFLLEKTINQMQAVANVILHYSTVGVGVFLPPPNVFDDL